MSEKRKRKGRRQGRREGEGSRRVERKGIYITCTYMTVAFQCTVEVCILLCEVWETVTQRASDVHNAHIHIHVHAYIVRLLPLFKSS